MSEPKFTVGDLQFHLRNLNPDDELEFDGGLTFNRIKRRGDDLQVMEFCEPQAFLDEKFRKKIHTSKSHLFGMKGSRKARWFVRLTFQFAEPGCSAFFKELRWFLSQGEARLS